MSRIFDDIKREYKFGDIAQKLIYWNVLCFLIPAILFSILDLFAIKVDFVHFISLSSYPMDLLWKPWSLLSYAFFHNAFWSLVSNMLVLYFSARFFLIFFNEKQFLGLYLLSALFSGIVFVGCFYFMGIVAPMVGASAAIAAILVAVTTYRPLMDVKLFFVLHVKLWHITFLLLLMDVLQLIALQNQGGHIAHLAGAFFGFLYVKLLLQGIDLSKIVSGVLDFFVNLFRKSPKTPFKKIYKTNDFRSTESNGSKIVFKSKTQQQIDEILDKINRSGYDSLTKEEKEFLFKAGK